MLLKEILPGRRLKPLEQVTLTGMPATLAGGVIVVKDGRGEDYVRMPAAESAFPSSFAP